jgi:hypothetical protein
MRELRREIQAFVRGLQGSESPSKMLHWFVPEAFENPVTRQLTYFLGRDSNASTAQIRLYVLQVLETVRKESQKGAGRCPDSGGVRDALLKDFRPDNQPDRDGFLLQRIDKGVLEAAEAETGSPEPPTLWLRGQIEQGQPLAAVAVVCNGIPLVTVWAPNNKHRWKIVAFAVPVP